MCVCVREAQINSVKNGNKVTLYSDWLRATALYTIYRNSLNLDCPRDNVNTAIIHSYSTPSIFVECPLWGRPIVSSKFNLGQFLVNVVQNTSQLAGRLESRARAFTSSLKLIPWEESLDNTRLKAHIGGCAGLVGVDVMIMLPTTSLSWTEQGWRYHYIWRESRPSTNVRTKNHTLKVLKMLITMKNWTWWLRDNSYNYICHEYIDGYHQILIITWFGLE